jgi:hypothetical protein
VRKLDQYVWAGQGHPSRRQAARDAERSPRETTAPAAGGRPVAGSAGRVQVQRRTDQTCGPAGLGGLPRPGGTCRCAGSCRVHLGQHRREGVGVATELHLRVRQRRLSARSEQHGVRCRHVSAARWNGAPVDQASDPSSTFAVELRRSWRGRNGTGRRSPAVRSREGLWAEIATGPRPIEDVITRLNHTANAPNPGEVVHLRL